MVKFTVDCLNSFTLWHETTLAMRQTSEEMARRWAMVLFWSVTTIGLGIGLYFVSALMNRPVYWSTMALCFVFLWHYLTEVSQRGGERRERREGIGIARV